MLYLNIKPNLHVSIDGKIVSYETHVGNITEEKIIKFGNYSRTTGKHFGEISRLTNLKIETETKEKILFSKFQFGARCVPSGKILSNSASMFLIKEGLSINSMINLLIESRSKKLSKSDLLIIKGYLKTKMKIREKELQKLIEIGEALQFQ